MRRPTILVPLTLFLGACKASFQPLPPQQLPDVLSRRARLDNFATYGSRPEYLVGKIVSVKKVNGVCPTGRTFNADTLSLKSYLKSGSVVVPQAKAEVVYQAAVKQTAGTQTVIATLGVDLKGSNAVELVVTDVREAFGEPLIDEDAVDAIGPAPAEVCARVLIKNVVVSLVHYKLYQEAVSGLNFTGTAFGFDGEAFNSLQQFQPDILISMDIHWIPQTKSMAATSTPDGVIFRIPNEGIREGDF